MQAPFWKVDGEARLALQADFRAVCRACSAVGIRQVLVPLVDHGRLEDTAQEEVFVQFLLEQSGFLADANLQVIVESDFEPAELARLMARLPEDRFGVNYDIGNSAALGHNPGAEFAAYGSRIVNVHVKDRRLGGTTVPLKTGNADFDAVFEGLAGLKYQGNFILQTARAEDGDHANALRQYRDLTAEWMTRYGLRATASPPLCD